MPPFAHTLERALFGFSGRVPTSVTRTIKGITHIPNNAKLFDVTPRKLQNSIYHTLASSVEMDWGATLRRRMAMSFKTGKNDAADQVDWTLLPCDLRRLEPHLRWQALNIFLNGWTTTTRMHSEVCDKCLWGCGGTDKIDHDFRCERIIEGIACNQLPLPDVSEKQSLDQPA